MDFKLIDRILALGNLIGHAGLAYIEADNELRVTSWNKGANDLFGHKEEDTFGRCLSDLVPLSEKELLSCRQTCKGKCSFDGSGDRKKKCHVFYSPIMNTKGEKLGVAVLAQSASAEKNSDANIQIEGQRIKDIFDFSPVGFLQADMLGKVRFSNPELAWMLGYETADSLSYQVTDVLNQMFYDRKRADEFMFALQEAGEVVRFRCRLKRKDGSFIWALCFAKHMFDESGRVDGFNGFAIDISETVRVEQELKKANEKLKMLSVVDGLTQIPNRRKFDEYLGSEWKRHFRNNDKISLILSDIDFFKMYNDTYGHQEGDTCLKNVAYAINESIGRSTDMAARYGGEEFAVILPYTDENGAMAVAEEIRNNIMNLEILHKKSTAHRCVTLSLGVATAVPGEHNSAESLISLADEALYEAKKNGRNQCAVKKDI